MPKNILTAMRHLNEIGNLAAHLYDFSIKEIRRALISLSTILEWYVAEQRPSPQKEEAAARQYLELALTIAREMAKNAQAQEDLKSTQDDLAKLK